MDLSTLNVKNVVLLLLMGVKMKKIVLTIGVLCGLLICGCAGLRKQAPPPVRFSKVEKSADMIYVCAFIENMDTLDCVNFFEYLREFESGQK